jgi:hypothetical protein
MSIKWSTGTAFVVALFVFAGDLRARDEDKDGGNRGKESSKENRSGGGSDRGGSGPRSSGGPPNQFKKGSGDGNRSQGFKKLDQLEFPSKAGSGARNNPSEKFNKDNRDKGDNFRRDDDNRDDRDRDGKREKHDDRDHANRHNDDNWKSWSKDGWQKDNWNTKYNTQHRQRHHGYWYGGVWYPPLVIVQRQPVIYLQPRQPAAVGQKWLGVTYENYDGGGAYVTGIYQGSPAEQLGIEVGDVIVTIDGRDATDLPRAIQASDGDITLQILRGRTGRLAQAQINIIR